MPGKRTGPRCSHPVNTTEGYCRPCRNEYRRKRYAQSKTAKRQTRIDAWKRQGINLTWEQYEQLLADQNGVCAICGGPPTGDYTSTMNIRQDKYEPHSAPSTTSA